MENIFLIISSKTHIYIFSKIANQYVGTLTRKVIQKLKYYSEVSVRSCSFRPISTRAFQQSWKKVRI